MFPRTDVSIIYLYIKLDVFIGLLQMIVNTCGRAPKYSIKQLSEALKLHDRYTFQEIADLTGICKSTLLNASKKMQI